jgi:recombination protein RecT
MANQITTQQNKVKSVESLMATNEIKSKFNDVLGKKAAGFMASIITASKNNLKGVEPNSILKGAMTAATLDLPIEPNLGFAYLVPYNNKVNGQWVKQAQFQIGYKGCIQLAIRSGQYKTINAIEVYEGEIKKINRLTGEIELNEDENEINRKKVVGYMAYFRLINGFEKSLYMSKEEVEAHAKKYSKVYASGKSCLWKTDFDAMAIKTVLKRLISKYGIMSIEMQKAVLSDQAIIDENDNLIYADNPEHEIEEKANKKTIDMEEIIDAEVEEVVAENTKEQQEEECPF